MKEQYDDLAFYTLQHPEQIYLIPQHMVGSYTAQLAVATTKPIALTFSLIGLYLFAEKKLTGKQI